MTRKTFLRCALGLVWIIVLAAPSMAGGHEAVGSLVGSRSTTLDGQRPLPHTVLLSGDQLQVNDGLALVTLDRGNRMMLGGQAEASFLREAKILTVTMAHGKVSIYHPPDGSGLRIRAAGVTVAPDGGGKVVGEIGLAGGTLVVTAKAGSLKIEKDGTTSEVAEGHTLTIATAAANKPASTGNPHRKYRTNREAQLAAVSSSAGGSDNAAEIALDHRHHRHVSPIHPGRRR